MAEALWPSPHELLWCMEGKGHVSDARQERYTAISEPKTIFERLTTTTSVHHDPINYDYCIFSVSSTNIACLYHSNAYSVQRRLSQSSAMQFELLAVVFSDPLRDSNSRRIPFLLVTRSSNTLQNVIRIRRSLLRGRSVSSPKHRVSPFVV